MENEVIDHTLKICIIGDYKTGKSSIFDRYTIDEFKEEEYYRGTGIEIRDKLILNLNGLNIKLQIFDTNCSDRFQVYPNSFLKLTHGFIVLYDITNNKSFNNLKNHLKVIRESSPLLKPPIVIIGNKSDLKNQITTTTTVDPIKSKDYCDSLNIPSFQSVSAKSGENINESFNTLIQLILSNIID